MKSNLRKATLGLCSGLIMAVALVAGWEGKSNKAYLDLVQVPTICYGQTHNVRLGDIKSDDECIQDLINEIHETDDVIARYVTVPLEPHERAAYISFIYNLGEGSFRRSTLLSKLNAGDHTGACNELRRWVYAGGRKVQGLINRREDERLLCLGLK